MNELAHESFVMWKKERGVPDECLFSLVLSVLVNLRPTSGKKTEKKRICRWGFKNKPEKHPSCQTLSKHVPTRATSWTPTVSSCAGSSAAGYWSAGSPLLWPVVTVELISGGSAGSSLIIWWDLCLQLLRESVMACCRNTPVKLTTSVMSRNNSRALKTLQIKISFWICTFIEIKERMF